jgi:hypothetical protein
MKQVSVKYKACNMYLLIPKGPKAYLPTLAMTDMLIRVEFAICSTAQEQIFQHYLPTLTGLS